MAAAKPGNASFPGSSAPSPAALPLAEAAVELFPALNDTALAHEIAAELGLVGNSSTMPQTSSRGGTPGWTTGLLAALISVAVLISMITVFVLIHRNLRRQRREVLESFLSFQEAEAAALEAADSARQRFLLARASRAAALLPRQPQEPPVVVVQPDLSPSLCIKDSPSRASGDDARDGSSIAPSATAAPAGSNSSGSGSGAGASEEDRQAGDGAAAASTAAAPSRARHADVEAGTAAAASSWSGGAGVAPPVRRLALDFPGLGATVLLLLPSGPRSPGLLLWNDGSSRASVLPGVGWRGWGAEPPLEPAPVFQSTIELAAHAPEQQEETAQPGEAEQQQQVGDRAMQADEGPESQQQGRQEQQQQPSEK